MWTADVNWLAVVLHGFLLGIFVTGVPQILFPTLVPPIVKKLYEYGKLRRGSTSAATSDLIVQLLQLPKRFFVHFYVFAVSYNAIVASTIFYCYYHRNVPEGIVAALDLVAGSHRTANADPVAVIVAIVLCLCQSVRRCYETISVSVFSSSKINISHYVMGVTFYFVVGTSLIAEAPGFNGKGFQFAVNPHASWDYKQLLGTSIYFWAAWHQYKCNQILANLRKDKKGRVVHADYKIPNGDWFTLVSCPHYLAEILIYLAINVVLNFKNHLIFLVFLFTVLNQLVIAVLMHRWYLKAFKDYPLKRKAIIPFLL